MRTRWLHSPLRTAGITTALFAAGHAIASTTCVTEIREQVLPCNSRCCRGIQWHKVVHSQWAHTPVVCKSCRLQLLGLSPHALSRRPSPRDPLLSPSPPSHRDVGG